MDGQIDLFDEIIVDNFAGGGGASTGIELATGRPVNIAINHDPDAILMHKTNHPYTEHYQASVWDINPEEVCRGRKVGLAWFSPDCKHFSKAKGGKPVDKKIRGLAWIVLRWAAKVRPRVIMLENVEEFQTWGPVRKGKPVKSKVGQTFNQFIEQLKALDYDVEYRELKACDYGAPTIRKRFFLIARCDGNPIVWPEATHAPADSPEVTTGKKKPYKSAAECIDFSLPCPSIFERAKPLVPNTQRRIARGLDKFVIREAKPYLVHIGNGERNGQLPRIYDIDKPLNTVVSSCKQYLVLPYLEQINHSGKETRGQKLDKQVPTITSKHGFAYIAPSLIQYHSETAKSEVRGQKINKPIMTIDSSGRYGVQIPFLTQYYSGADHANTVTNPLQTVTVKPRHFLNDCFLTVLRNHMDSKSINEPLNTITARAMHFSFVKVYVKQYSEDVWLGYWQKIRAMLNEYTEWNLNDNEIIVFNIDGTEYFIYDIGMRMLQPKELYAAQGFPKDYVIEKDYLGNTYPKSKQVARCGNAVPPPFATALVRANLPEYCDTYILTMADLMERMAI
nr:MAG TPA: DNA cytosine methyltransferase [Caudoviricetes sp.]